MNRAHTLVRNLFSHTIHLTAHRTQRGPGRPVAHPVLLQTHADDPRGPHREAAELQHAGEGTR